MGKQLTHQHQPSEHRTSVRLAVSVDSLLRKKLRVAPRTELHRPYPLPLTSEECVELLRLIAETSTTQVMSPSSQEPRKNYPHDGGCSR